MGIGTVINGRAEDGEENTAWGAQMEKLGRAEGMMLKIPPGPDSNGQEPSKAKFRGGTALVPADTPAGSELFGYKKSVGHATKSICKGCHCLQHGDPPPYRQPNSFVSSLHGWKRSCAGRKKQFKLRSAQDFKDYLQKLQALERNEISETDLEAWKQEVGVNDFLTAMSQCRFLSLTTGCPMYKASSVAGSRGVVIGNRRTASKAARVCGVVRLSRGAMTHRGQAPWHVLPSAMQREQPISLVRSLSASIEHRVWQALVVVVGDRDGGVIMAGD